MLIYEFIPHRLNDLEFRLISVASLLRDYMKTQRVIITKKGVLISYHGSKVILEEDEGSNGNPVSIIIPEAPEPTQEGRLMDYHRINYDTCRLKFKSEPDRQNFCWNTIIALNELSSRVRCAMTDGIDVRGSPFVILGNPLGPRNSDIAYHGLNSVKTMG